MISGVMSTSLSFGALPTLRSITIKRIEAPTCGAARPIPCSAYMVSNISAISLRSSALKSVMGSPGRERIGSGYLTILRIIRQLESPYLFDVSVKISSQFQRRIAAEFFLGQPRKGQRHHRLAHHQIG